MKIVEDSPSLLTALDRPNSYIGRSVPRPNAKRLLAGRGRYVTDIVLPRMLHVAYVRSPYAHARIVSIDAQAAREMPGVKLVATGKDLARLCTPWVGTMEHFKGMKSPPQLPLPESFSSRGAKASHPKLSSSGQREPSSP